MSDHEVMFSHGRPSDLAAVRALQHVMMQTLEC